MLNAVKHLYLYGNQFRLNEGGRGASLKRKSTIVGWMAMLTVGASTAQAQNFNFAAKEAVKIPAPIELQIRNYIESHDGISLKIFAGQYQYVPVFNVLNHAQKLFTDGIYFFSWGSHDSGRLFIYRKGKVVFLKNGSVADIVGDYTSFLKQYQVSEVTQANYLSAIAAFMQFRLKDHQMLMKNGALDELKDKH